MNVIKKILTNILIYGTEFIVIMLSVFPIVWVALSSFKTNAQILEGPFTLPTGITTAKEAYTYLFQKYDFFSYFGNSLMISLISTVISQCHLDKDYTKNSVYRNMYPVLFL